MRNGSTRWSDTTPVTSATGFTGRDRRGRRRLYRERRASTRESIAVGGDGIAAAALPAEALGGRPPGERGQLAVGQRGGDGLRQRRRVARRYQQHAAAQRRDLGRAALGCQSDRGN